MVHIRLANGKKSIYSARFYLLQNGFTYNERAYGKSFYEKETEDGEAAKWENYAKWHKYSITVIPKEYTRSTNYRETFFKNNRPLPHSRYRCAYCGRKLNKKDITVDHIFPVNRLSYDLKARKMAKNFGITGANEAKNLVAACQSCNSRKGKKMGGWIYRGFLGKCETLWKIRMGIRYLVYFVFDICVAELVVLTLGI